MSESIQTTGGVLHPDDIEFINNCICEVFDCEPSQIAELQPLQKGLSNSVLSFKFNGGKYVFRFPGLGSEVLIDRGRESVVQKQIEDAGVDTSLVAMSVRYGWRISLIYNYRLFLDEMYPLCKYKFEGTEFYGPHNADALLSRCYGEYMNLPPIEKRHPHYSAVHFL